MFNTIKRLASESVWGSAGSAKIDPQKLFMMQVGYPLFDIMCILFGIFGSIGGIPALKDTFGEQSAIVWALGLGFGGLVCLFGVALESKLRLVEYIGKCFLSAMMGCYAVAIFIAGISIGDMGRFAVGFIIVAVTIIPVSRVMDIARGGIK